MPAKKENIALEIQKLQHRLEIEAALDRVRMKVLAMRTSDALGSIAVTIFEELANVGILNIRCGMGVIHNDRGCDMWTATSTTDGKIAIVTGDEMLSGHSLLDGIFDSWKAQKTFSYTLEGDDLKEYYEVISKTNYHLPKSSISFSPESKHFFLAVFNAVGGLYAYRSTPFTVEMIDTMKRFINTFDHAYNRYNELKRIEAQTREVQIEAALESIRASAMAMESSDDLINVANVLREQMAVLGQAELESTLVHLYEVDTSTFEAWFAYKKLNTSPPEILTGQVNISKTSTEWGREVIANYRSNKTEYTITAPKGAKLNEWYQELEKFAKQLPGDDTLVDYDNKGKIIVPEILYYYFSKFSGGALLMITNQEPSDESKELQKRAALVFDMAYVRFVDLQKLELQARELSEINAIKNTFYINITHEFRTPLTVIRGMAETIKSHIDNNDLKKVNKSLNLIKRNSNGLLKLVNGMLDLAKIESGNLELQLVQSDIIPYVKYLGESFHSLAEQKEIQLMIYSEIDHLIMDFDIDKMSSIISNVLSNALKFTDRKGKIIMHLNVLRKDGENLLIIKIKDSGKGIMEKELNNIFNRFYQVDGSASREYEGTGIGLALTKELVELMSGTIKVKSSIDIGSTFTIEIPVTNSAQHIEAVNSEYKLLRQRSSLLNEALTETSLVNAEPILNTSNPLVLIVEDNADVAYYLETCLDGKYETIHAANGNLGIELALKHIPDIIISDVMMPGKDGYEVCDTLKSHELTDHIPIILLTAKADRKARLEGLSKGADAYLAKPFDQEELFTRLNQLIALRQKLLRKFDTSDFSQLLIKRLKDPETKLLQKAIKLIHQYIDDHTFGTVQLAHKMQLSESQVYRKLKAISGKSTALFIRSIRLQKAKELIKSTDMTVSEVSYDVGFNDPAWFSRAFKEEYGFSPSSLKS